MDHLWHGEDEMGCGWMAWLTFFFKNGWRCNNERKGWLSDLNLNVGGDIVDRWMAGHNNSPVVWIYMRRCGCGRGNVDVVEEWRELVSVYDLNLGGDGYCWMTGHE